MIPHEIQFLVNEIHNSTRNEFYGSIIERVNVVHYNDDIHIYYFGPALSESFDVLVKIITDSWISPRLKSLLLDGPDEGANGTINWDISKIFDAEISFPSLISFSVQANIPGNHNRVIIGSGYEENGSIAKVIKCCPKLQEISVPSAPNGDFFSVPSFHLNKIKIEAGYDAQNFIFNLSESTNLVALKTIEWSDYCETYIDGWEKSVTPFFNYKKLFESNVFDQISSFVLSNSILTDGEMVQLRKLRPRVQFMQINSAANYIR